MSFDTEKSPSPPRERYEVPPVTLEAGVAVDMDFEDSPNKSGWIVPRFIVLHYTASWDLEAAQTWLTNPKSRASSHFIVDRDGSAVQLVNTNYAAWHAGPSRHQGYTGLNYHSVGIEMVNPGYLKLLENGKYQDDFGKIHEMSSGDLIESPHPRVGSGTYYWPIYPQEQLIKVESIVEALIETYPILDIVTHEQIDLRGWKTDPGPAFPMRRFRALLGDRGNNWDVYETTATHLNIRSGPGVAYKKLGSLNQFSRVAAYERRGPWVRMSDDGWVHNGYLRRIK